MKTKHSIYSDVLDAVKEKVDDIFLSFQENLGIKSGDIMPLTALDLEDKEEDLANLIAETLLMQRNG